ncbi:uncharacterized protein LOC131995357 [Stomoxys calcitrans]|uniref:uncharacterized protein LOC131995357 n=1 Tax=Stomoxys calcitrans TaxID=35570 RepID=UPI0027E2473D|nr:uncharacterized protein LOC131995357 [Stomoxys calcitrans]XP_059220001.1 uncharacterized protein LOC131995357 [Stomoxys calcitrans]
MLRKVFKTKLITTNFLLAKLLLSAFILFSLEQVSAIKCYKCAVILEKTYSYTKNLTIVTPMCSKFYESDEYIVDCKYSTMCLKTISTLHLQNGQNQETVTRGCAPQKDTKQVFSNGRWNQEHSVQEVYEEGCKELSGDSISASSKTHCYCRGDLCNTSSRSFTMNVFIWLFGFVTLMLLK